jgi:hypothetical protein
MNTTSNHRPGSIPLALTAAASIVTVTVIGSAGTANASSASEPRGSRVASVSTANPGSFGEPLAALGGQSLAQYLSDHWARVIVAGV